jgi:8-oxo-dGTP pyrophosphatase MutT (NUDIX family)
VPADHLQPADRVPPTGAPSHLVAALDACTGRGPDEESDLARLRAVARSADPWGRATPLHVTGSALVVHPPSGRVLLRWHQRQEAWLQVGGHGDPGEDDPLAVALREGHEETGLADLRPWPEGRQPVIVHAVIVDVPANAVEPAHRHGDLRYVLATATPDGIVAEDEGAPLRWLSVAEALELTAEENLRETLRRVGELLAAGPVGG